MGRRETYRQELEELPTTAWPDYLSGHSGLPGPRANLELIHAVADLADVTIAQHLINTGDVYLTCCGAVALGAALADAADPALLQQLHAMAADDSWRVRESVAMALQRLGDRDLPRLQAVVRDWVGDPDPLVRRAAVAAICEPRLLGTPADAAVAVQVCEAATGSLSAIPAERRRDGGVRVLRQALGYGWSVAVAADAVPGLAAFGALSQVDDPDVAWVVRENLRKQRLQRLL